MEQYGRSINGYYPQKKNNSDAKLARFLLVLFCMFFMGIGGLLIFLGTKQSDKEKEKESYYVDVEAVISDITVTGTGDDRHHTVYIQYTYEGKEYDGSLNYYSSTMNIGDPVDITCDPSNPSDFMAKGFFGKTSGILYIIGGIFAGVALFIMIIGLVVTNAVGKSLKSDDNYINDIQQDEYDSYSNSNRDSDGYTTSYAKIDYDNYYGDSQGYDNYSNREQ